MNKVKICKYWPAILIMLIVIGWIIYDRNVYPPTTTDMIQEAEVYALIVTGQIPPKQFKFDGCTLVPESIFGYYDITRFCLEHDFAYWSGGTENDRLLSDIALRNGIASHGGWFWVESRILYYVLRITGDSYLAKLVGRNWGHGYNQP
jgi:hypothetical protein